MNLHSNLFEYQNKLLRIYRRSEAIVFYRTKDAFGGLSNMASCYPVQVNDIHILTAEALYQACRFPHMPEVQKRIINQHNAVAAKKEGRLYLENSRADWHYVRNKIMRWCLRVKLAHHYDSFGQLLLATSDQPIVEQSSRDDYWGAKLAEKAGDVLIGQNILGRLLMELREELKGDLKGLLKIVPPLDIQEFLLLGEPIRSTGNMDFNNLKINQKSLF